jgi:hypothetical protein
MHKYELEDYQARIIISALDERRDVLLNKFDKVRRMKAALDDDLYNTIMQSHHIELQLLTDTIMSLTPDA